MTVALSRKQALAIKPCRYGCGTEVQYATYTKTGSAAPLELEPDSAVGRISLDVHTMTYIILNVTQVGEAIERGHDLYVNHLMRCPVLLRQREQGRK
jgi:hypothetical protein